MVLVKIYSLQLIILDQFYPPLATLLQRIIRGFVYIITKNGTQSKKISRKFSLIYNKVFTNLPRLCAGFI